MKYILSTILILSYSTITVAQDLSQSHKDTVIIQDFIQNPSFEAYPQRGRSGFKQNIENWADCTFLFFPNTNGIDIHGINTDFFEVSDRPSDGESYLGLVARENDTWETISQILSEPLLVDHLYSFDIDVKLDNNLKSVIRPSGKLERFNHPLTLKIYLSNRYCAKDSIVYTSEPIENLNWETLEVSFIPSQEYRYITLEAFYVLPVTAPYNGNIMIDNIRNMKIITN